MMSASRNRTWLAYLGALLLVAFSMSFVAGITASQQAEAQSSVRPPANVTNATGGTVPGMSRSNDSSAEMWRKVRKGVKGTVSIPDKKAGQLVQSEGDNWRALRNGPMSTYGAWGLLAIIVLLALFFLFRGRIRVDSGMSGKTLVRFNDIERIAHWLLAVSFIVLAITGLNITYGKYFLLPVIGKSAFASIAYFGKLLHNYVAFGFMAGLVMILVLWIKDNFPSALDFEWIAQGGGMFSKGVHPPAKKFNAGQKILFWAVIWGGLALNLTGISLLFPFQIDFPFGMAPIEQMHFMNTWHTIIAVVMTVGIIAHIYIGTVGMEGAFDAMGSGEVDRNWAKEHHSEWVKEVSPPKARKKSGKAAPAAAE